MMRPAAVLAAMYDSKVSDYDVVERTAPHRGNTPREGLAIVLVFL